MTNFWEWLNTPILLNGQYPILLHGPVLLICIGLFGMGVGIGLMIGARNG